MDLPDEGELPPELLFAERQLAERDDEFEFMDVTLISPKISIMNRKSPILEKKAAKKIDRGMADVATVLSRKTC